MLEDIEYDHVGEGEILVEIAAFSVCASDIKAAAGKFHLNPPLVLGHEASGIGMSFPLLISFSFFCPWSLLAG